MNNNRYFYYGACREHAGMTQESAAEMLHIAVRTLSKYENEGGVPDCTVDAMCRLYNTPLLAWWHLKNFSELGKYLPSISVVTTTGDLIFQLLLAKDELGAAFDALKGIYADEKIDTDEQAAYIEKTDVLRSVGGKIMSATVYADKVIAQFGK